MKKEKKFVAWSIFVTVFVWSVFITVLLTVGCTSANSQVKNEDVKRSEVSHSGDSEIESYDFGEPDRPAAVLRPSEVRGNNQPNFIAGNQNSRMVNASANVQGNHDLSDYFQTGLASWYGREFNGKTTASGERFDMNDLTAAHKTLPFGSIVEVTNLNNGKSTRVKINDRGPYRGSRIIDLSHYAAGQIGIVEIGEEMVGLRIIQRGSGNIEASEVAQPQITQPRGSTVMQAVNDDMDNEVSFSVSGSFSIQAGAFYSRRNAMSLKERVEDVTNARANVITEGDFFKVRISGIPTRRTAERYKNVLAQENISSYIIEHR